MDTSSVGSFIGFLIAFSIILNIAVIIVIIVALVKTYNRIKSISYNTKQILFHTEQTNKTLSAQYQLDHCYMNRFLPHEWHPTGIQAESTYEFKCVKCGMIIHLPKYM